MKNILTADLDSLCKGIRHQFTRTIDAMAFNKHPLELNLRDIKSEWSKRTRNLERCAELLEQLKAQLIQEGGFLSSMLDAKRQPSVLMHIARSMLEMTVEYCILTKKFDEYERNMCMLNVYYYDFAKIMPESEQMHMFIGLNLLYMLALNRISAFHIELERLPFALLSENKYISPVLTLENFAMEGRYNKILSAKNSMPSELYNNFMDLLVNTVREEIASCLEKSYEMMPAKLIVTRLGLKSLAELRAIAEKRGWPLDSQDNYNFSAMATRPREPLGSNDIAHQALSYARDLDQIV